MSRGREQDEEDDNFLAEDEQDAKCIVCGKDGEQSDNTLLQCSNESCWHMVHHQCSMPCTDPDVLGVLCTRCTPERDDPRYSPPPPPPNTCTWMQVHTRMYLHCTCWPCSNQYVSIQAQLHYPVYTPCDKPICINAYILSSLPLVTGTAYTLSTKLI